MKLACEPLLHNEVWLLIFSMAQGHLCPCAILNINNEAQIDYSGHGLWNKIS